MPASRARCKPGRVGAVRDDDGDRARRAARRDRVDDRLQIAAAAGDQGPPRRGRESFCSFCHVRKWPGSCELTVDMPRRPRARSAGIVSPCDQSRIASDARCLPPDEDYRMMRRRSFRGARHRFGDAAPRLDHHAEPLAPDPVARVRLAALAVHALDDDDAHAAMARGAAGRPAPVRCYQGRYKAIPVQSDDHLLTVARYVRAQSRARSAWWLALKIGAGRARGGVAENCHIRLPDRWPIPEPVDWTTLVNEPIEPDRSQSRSRCHRVRVATTAMRTGRRRWRHSFALKRTFRAQGRP